MFYRTWYVRQAEDGTVSEAVAFLLEGSYQNIDRYNSATYRTESVRTFVQTRIVSDVPNRRVVTSVEGPALSVDEVSGRPLRDVDLTIADTLLAEKVT